MAHIAVKGLLTRMLPLIAVSYRAWPSDLLPLSSLTWLATAKTCVSGISAMIVIQMDRTTGCLSSIYLSQMSKEISDNAG
jgi:hypothetical protein